MEDLNNTILGQAQGAVRVGGKGHDDQEPLSLESINKMLRETIQMVNRLGTVLETSVRDGPIRGASSVQAGAPEAATEYGTGGRLAYAAGAGRRLDYRPETAGVQSQSSRLSPGTSTWRETVDSTGFSIDGANFGGDFGRGSRLPPAPKFNGCEKSYPLWGKSIYLCAGQIGLLGVFKSDRDIPVPS